MVGELVVMKLGLWWCKCGDGGGGGGGGGDGDGYGHSKMFH